MKFGRREIDLRQIKSIEEQTRECPNNTTAQRPTEIVGYRIVFRWLDYLVDDDGDTFTRDHLDVDVFTGVEIIHKWATYRFDEVAVGEAK